ncbi:MAG: hypothetical protein Q8939_14285 [Bacteroidota bacterium]|nr:hypothetical protein [Bacteroidota bacterium]MDP4213457.1 hypothetical protein [Bacteroidota bacterium]
MKIFACIAFMFCLFVFPVWAQENKPFQALHFTSSHTSFPDTGRSRDYLYDSVLYTSSAHYSDSSVLLIVPKHLKAASRVDLVFWFHGWHNNIDTAAAFYGLTKQFIASKRNAILVLPETARNAPDSYGGKLEQPGVFKALVNDVMNELRKSRLVPDRADPGNIVLAGHSGAFRVIAYMLQNGQLPVQEVFLFDALYGQVDKYLTWIYEDPKRHFVHWFTNHGGGTDIVSDTVMQRLTNHHTHYALIEEADLKPDVLKNNRILFVHSAREHNVIINNPDDFLVLLESSFILKPY